MKRPLVPINLCQYFSRSVKDLILGWTTVTAGSFLVLRALAADGAAPYTATGYSTGVPYTGDTLAFAPDNVQLRNVISLLRVQSADARLTGRRTMLLNGVAQPDGSQTIYGTWTGEVGTWNVTDPKNPIFSATGGLWDGSWNGRRQPDGSYEIQTVGRGTGGAVDGLEVAETATRGPGAMTDPNVTIAYQGTVGPSGALNGSVLDNFDDNKVTDWHPDTTDGGSVSFVETSQQFTINWQPRSAKGWHNATARLERIWRAEQGKTLEWRVELVSLGEHANASGIVLRQTEGYYLFFLKGRDFLMILKAMGPNVIVLACEKTSFASANILLSGAMTRSGSELMMQVRLLDKANPNRVLQEISAIDAFRIDDSLNAAEIKALTGMSLAGDRDIAGQPFFFGDRVYLTVAQYGDGSPLPLANATFDNYELWTHDLPILTSDPAVRIRWPASVFPFTVQGAPKVNGPWLPVLEPVFDSGGVKQLTVPTTDAMKLFRLK